MAEEVKVGNRTYALGSVLGVGGFSEVRKGVDKETRKRVALKIMYSGKCSSSEMKNQLMQVQKEIKAMKQLSHPNLIRLLGYDLKCTVKKQRAIVMVQQLAPKGELFDYLMYTKKFEENQANALFKQLIAGLEAMHKKGIAHRDLKPENVLFDNQFNLKLADFGFAYVFQKGEGPKTAMRTELGTKGYMAPEIINNKKYSEKADIFAAGVILFIMLAGFPPFQNAVAKDWWFDKLMKGKYKLFWMAHERTAKFSPAAKDILQKMLAPKEKDRLDVHTVQQTKFWSKHNMTKEELVKELKHRKKVVDTEKAKEEKSRDTLIEIMIPKGDLNMPNVQPILLSSLLHNAWTEELKSDELTKDALKVKLVELTDKKQMQDEVRESLEDLDDEKAKEIGSLLASNAGKNQDELREALKENLSLSEDFAELLSTQLKTTKLGVVDDFEVIKKFAKIDEEAHIPEYEIYKVKANSYKTKMNFGLLGYCLKKFMQGRGKMVVNPGSAKIQFDMPIKKTVVLPNEDESGNIVWKKGQIRLHIESEVQLSHDKDSGYNVVTFTNISKDHMAMQEYKAIVKEFTENRTYLLRYFLEGNFEPSDKVLENYEIGEDYDCHAEEEEEVEAKEEVVESK